MDVTSMLNTASAAAAKVEDREAAETVDDEVQDSSQTPSATTAGSTAPSSMVSTPPSDRTLSRKPSESRMANRNRTPWDAGGYSLPFSLDAKNLIRSSPGAASLSVSGFVRCDSSSPTDTTDLGITNTSPKSTSPRHKFSDSRSSFSSSYTIASSTASVSHSRISSLSTVSENQPLAALITDFSQLETNTSDPSTSCCNSNQIQKYGMATRSPENQDLQVQSPTPVRSRHNITYEASPEASPRSVDRAQSPSDAVMIPRLGSEMTDEVMETGNMRLQNPASHSRSQSRTRLLQPDSSAARRHKRAVSAPDFSSIGPSSFDPRFPTFGPIPEPTPSPSQHSNGDVMDSPGGSSTRASPTYQGASANDSYGLMVSSPADSPMAPGMTSATTANANSERSLPTTDAAAEAPVNFEIASACMYRGDCQTGSQLRKAISHIFGRNKLCTRMIPTGVWVHYCRKHYQRTRYRNGGEYPQRQIGLVQEQVKRVQAWSDSNTRLGQGPVLKDWSLSVRKREQLRLDSKMAVTGKKRPYQDDAGDEDEEGYDDERAEMSGTAVPDWVIAQIGDGYSTTAILEVVERLRQDIDQGRLQQIPDIEILPNIVTDATCQDPVTNTKKSYAKRRTAGTRGGMGGGGYGAGVGGGHRRSQSVNTGALHSHAIAMARRRSQPNNFYVPPSVATTPQMMYASELQFPMEKRQRVDNDGLDRQGGLREARSFSTFDAMAGLGNAHARPSLGGRMQLAHRPAFGGIRESQAEGQGYYYGDSEELGSNGYSSGYQQPRSFPEGTVHGEASGVYESGRQYSSNSYAYESRQEYDRHWAGRGVSAGAGVGVGTGTATGAGSLGVLPAPTPQRFAGPSVAPYGVSPTTTTRRAGMHQRSQSEAAGFFHHPQPSHHPRPTSSSGPTFGNHEQSVAGEYRSQACHQDGRSDDQRCGNVNDQPAYAMADESEYQEKYDSVQLPPLHSIPALQSLPPIQPHASSHPTASFNGGPVAMDRHLSPVMPRHSRHQSSPAVTRVLPPMQVTDAALPGPGGPLPPMCSVSLAPADA